jgi:hypothetical protein
LNASVKQLVLSAEGHLANNLLVETVAASKRDGSRKGEYFMSYETFQRLPWL